MCCASRQSGRNLSRPFSGGSPFLTPFALPVQPILENLSLTPGSVVLELGALACRFTLPIARYIATKSGDGSVYACDFNEEWVARTFQKAKDAHLNHLVVPLFWNTDFPIRVPLENESVDVVITISMPLFRNRGETFVEECLRVLYPGGKLFVAEWRDAKRALSRDESDLEMSKETAWHIFTGTHRAVCHAVNIPELEWAVLIEKSVVQIS